MKSETDWEYLENMTDDDIDYTDIPPLPDEFYQNATLRIPAKKQKISIRLDADILAWFKSQGKGYQTHINAVLRIYMDGRNTGVPA
jgi:uncharacterized protein (DUF4415 family)